MTYQHIFFDLDGTLIDSAEGIYQCFRYALNHFGITEVSDQQLAPVIGPPLFDSFRDLFGFSPEKANKAVAIYRQRYEPIGIWESRVYEGIPQLLKRLHQRDVKLYLATSKPEKFARAILERYQLAPFFTYAAGASPDDRRSSKEAVLEYLFEKSGITDRTQVLMVGDRHYDLNGAAAFHINGAGVLYGFGDRRELEACPHVYLAETPGDLGDFILNRSAI